MGTKDIPKGSTEGILVKGNQRLKETTKRSREEEVELIKEVIQGKRPKQRMVLEVEQTVDAYQKLTKLDHLGRKAAREKVQ